MNNYSIKVYKEYFNFASAHFLVLENGSREPLHGHNYRVRVQARANGLKDDMVVDFLDIKPIVRSICDSLDHKFLFPEKNKYITKTITDKNIEFTTSDGAFYSIPNKDVLILPIENISSERLAEHIAGLLQEEISKKLSFHFSSLEIEVEESPGQSAVYILES